MNQEKRPTEPGHQAESSPSSDERSIWLVSHRDIHYTDDIVYMSGNVFDGCKFERCTLVFKGGAPTLCQNCIFNSCHVHVDVLFHDVDNFDQFWEAITKLRGALPPTKPSLPLASDPVSFGGTAASVSSQLLREPPLGSNDVGPSDRNT
jgi:hypothetical protein